MSDQPSSHTPFFSVIIPTYNREKSIVEAVESVLSQTFKDFELLVIDDGSTDGTADLLKPIAERDSRLRYIFQENAERSAARNNGIDQSKGQYICFLDSDDIYLPEHLKVFQIAILKSNVEVAMFFSKSTSNPIDFTQIESVDPKIESNAVDLILTHTLASQQVCCHRSILCEHKYDDSINVAEDQELWSRIVNRYPLISTGMTTVVIRDLGDRTIDIKKLDAYKLNLLVKKKIIKNDQSKLISKTQRNLMLSASHYRLADSYLANDMILGYYYHLLISIFLSPEIYRKEKIKRLIKPR